MKTHVFEKILILILLAVLVSWQIYVQYFAVYEVLKIIAVYQIDKIFHLLGGFMIVVFVSIYSGKASLIHSLLIVLVASILWEFIELQINTDVTTFFQKKRDLWIKDTIWDLIASFVGACAYLIYIKIRDHKSNLLSEKK